MDLEGSSAGLPWPHECGLTLWSGLVHGPLTLSNAPFSDWVVGHTIYISHTTPPPPALILSGADPMSYGGNFHQTLWVEFHLQGCRNLLSHLVSLSLSFPSQRERINTSLPLGPMNESLNENIGAGLPR